MGAGRSHALRVGLIAAAAALVAAGCGSSTTTSSSPAVVGHNTIPSDVNVSDLGTTTTDIATVMGEFESSGFTAYATKDNNTLDVGVILPDTVSSTRYVDFDAPYLTDAFADAGYSASEFSVENAQGSDPTEIEDAVADMNLGAKVLVVDPLDGPTGLTIEADAAARHVAYISYDRATFPTTGTAYYDSFNNFDVGELIGENFESCVTSEKVKSPVEVFELDGGKDTDPNAISFAQGYDHVVWNTEPTGENEVPAGTTNSLGYKLVEDEYSPGWSVSDAGTIFQEAFTAHPDINAVITANDEMNAEVIADLQADGVKAGTIPTTGQDATPTAMAAILEGWQCGTVYKPIFKEAEDAVMMATILLAGDTIPKALLNGTTTDPTSSSIVEPASLLTPEWVDAANMNSTVVADGFDSASTICGELTTTAEIAAGNAALDGACS
jgi:D-xylose transport system substrate-binding protein